MSGSTSLLAVLVLFLWWHVTAPLWPLFGLGGGALLVAFVRYAERQAKAQRAATAAPTARGPEPQRYAQALAAGLALRGELVAARLRIEQLEAELARAQLEPHALPLPPADGAPWPTLPEVKGEGAAAMAQLARSDALLRKIAAGEARALAEQLDREIMGTPDEALDAEEPTP